MCCLKLQRTDFVKSLPIFSVFLDIFMCILFWLILFHLFVLKAKITCLTWSPVITDLVVSGTVRRIFLLQLQLMCNQHTIDKVMYNFHAMPNVKVMKKDRSLPGDMRKGMCLVVALCRTTYFQWLCLICLKVNLQSGKLKFNYIPLINWGWGHYREISDQGLDVHVLVNTSRPRSEITL